ncbi:hypothetical protein H6G76_25220 [Nostoc sp. FACHB-152]|uniref:hypothetical protein n=1 Tax=unclassified Nostoc TaxID=2593658 RepID=UPI0016827F13|nr:MULTISPECIES: hypothetical protein [unclassified Nostoc]MBD2450396.1 hypothetical protein [Nostoc sp. FACHB-152]MBD2471617.1 hypothetical protein [Nostoc sp. FACHB-145]
MQLSIVEEKLQIEFTWKEKLLAARFHKLWQIPLANIKNVTTAKPQSTWKELRAPGTLIPGVIKAGTYYTDRGKEFWYVNKDSDYLNIELQDESYERIILTVENNNYWQQQLTQLS